MFAPGGILPRFRAACVLPCCTDIGVHHHGRRSGRRYLFAWLDSRKSRSIKTAWLTVDQEPRMKFFSFIYRALSNFLFLLLVYYSLNFLDKYQQRAVVAILVLVYSATRAATALRSFYFFQRIERLEGEARRLVGMIGDGPAASASRRQIVSDVSVLRRAGEMNTYIDLLFLALIVLLCISKIVTE
jgi:hypothetical protein